MEKTLVLLKPSCVQRQLIGEIVNRFERRGLRVAQNIVHASDSTSNAEIELKRFFKDEEIFDYTSGAFGFIYGSGEAK